MQLTDTRLWWTHTCKIGWDVNGIYPPGAQGSDIQAVHVNQARTLIASSDSSASLCLYRYPCLNNSQDTLRYLGHSNYVKCVKFVEDVVVLPTAVAGKEPRVGKEGQIDGDGDGRDGDLGGEGIHES